MPKRSIGPPAIAFAATTQAERDEIYADIAMKLDSVGDVMREHNSIKVSDTFHLDGKWIARTSQWEAEVQQRYKGKKTVAAVLIDDGVQATPHNRANIRGAIMNSLNDGTLWHIH